MALRKKSDINIIKLFINKRTKLNQVNKDKETPLKIAKKYNCKQKILNLLIDETKKRKTKFKYK